MTATIPAVSVEYVYVPGIIAFNFASPDPQDPRTLPVSVAFMTGTADPSIGDWHTAEWVTWAAASGAIARYLLDPTGLSLAAGTYTMWLKITGGTEKPARPVGTVTIT